MSTIETLQYDAIVIGGGPCGSTAAAVLAQHGRKTAILEKNRFPRYHVGESLLPYCYFTLDRIGMVEKLNRSSFIRKHSVQFASASGKISQPFYFFEHLNHPAAQTWQVVRSTFDRMLLNNAAEHGADVHEGVAAKKLLMDGDAVVGVEAKDEAGRAMRFAAPITLDCSGRDGFAISRLGWRKRDPKLSKVAIWTLYRGGLRGEGINEGATTIAYLPERGWFWHIPLPDDVISVGITAEHDYLFREGKDLPRIFEREIAQNRWVTEALGPAEQFGEYWVTGDYSYRSEYSAKDGLVLAGDAFAFLDPVFSSGVFLALKSGEMAADAAHEALDAGDVSAGRFDEYSHQLLGSIEAMRKLVYAFYDTGFSFGDLLKKHPQLRGDLTDCLIGNLFKDFTDLFDATAEFAQTPPPLPHGRPFVSSTTPTAAS